jgi:protein subunit release factor B
VKETSPLEKEELERLKSESRIDFFKSSGPGGQRKNKRETAVRVTHEPSGIVVIATESRSQAMNLALALKRLKEKIERRAQRQKPRIATKTPRSVTMARLENKKKRAEVKQARRVSPGEM